METESCPVHTRGLGVLRGAIWRHLGCSKIAVNLPHFSTIESKNEHINLSFGGDLWGIYNNRIYIFYSIEFTILLKYLLINLLLLVIKLHFHSNIIKLYYQNIILY